MFTNNIVDLASRFKMLHSNLVPFIVTFLSTVITIIDSMYTLFTNSVVAVVISSVNVALIFMSMWLMVLGLDVLS